MLSHCQNSNSLLWQRITLYIHILVIVILVIVGGRGGGPAYLLACLVLNIIFSNLVYCNCN